MEKIYLNSEEYDAAVNAYRNRHGYDDMSDEEKEAFDERLDKVVAKKEDGIDPSEDTESTDSSSDTKSVDNRSDSDKLRDELKSQYGYDDMSDEQNKPLMKNWTKWLVKKHQKMKNLTSQKKS